MSCFLRLMGLSVVAVSLVGTGFGWADTRKKEEDKSHTIKGRISEIVGDKDLVVKTADGKEVKLRLDVDSKLRYNRRDAKVDEFKKGMRVRVTYESQGDKNRVLTLTAHVIRTDELARRFSLLMDKIKTFTSKEKTEYVKSVDDALTEVEEMVDQLLAKAEDASGDMRQEISKEAEEIRDKAAAAQKRLAKLKEAGNAAATEMKEGLKEALEDLRKACEKARARFDEP